MTGMDIVLEMGEGNPGALTCCAEIVKIGSKIDPDDAMQGWGSILMLDSLGLYGSRLYQLWSDVCKRHTGKMIAVLRAFQLGQLAGATEDAINHAVDNRGEGLDLDAIVNAVKERLPNFNISATA